MPEEKTILWRRLVSASSLDSWMECLAWVGLERVVTREVSGKKRVSLEVYCANRRDANQLVRQCGGEIRLLARNDWLDTGQRPFVLPVANHCCIVSPGAVVGEKHKSLPRIVVPAAMAFGTGEHPTTAMCLRQLLKCSGKRSRVLNRPLRILDAGTGSGILALAASLAGHDVTGVDFDPECIREALRNQQRNSHVPPVKWNLGKVESIPLRSRYDLIVANLFLNLLGNALPRFQKILTQGGPLILSGILQQQEQEALNLISINGFQLTQKLRKGKWLCVLAHK